MVTNYMYSVPTGWDSEVATLHVLITIFADMHPSARERTIAFLRSRFLMDEPG